MKKLLAIMVLGLFILTSCVSGRSDNKAILFGSEELLITTYPYGAKCQLKNDKEILNILSPERIKVKRSIEALKITCTKAGYKETTRNFYLREQGRRLGVDDVDIPASESSAVLSLAKFGFKSFKNRIGTYANSVDGNNKPAIHLDLIKKTR